MRQAISFDRPLNGLRICRSVVHGDVATPPPLLGLRDLMRREEEARQSVMQVSREMQVAISQIIPLVDCNLQGITEMATELGLAIAREVVGEAIDGGRFDPSEVVLKCLRDSVRLGTGGEGESVVRVELAPEDLDLVIARLESDPEIRAMVTQVEFQTDPRLARGCATVSTDGGRLLYDPHEVLDRVAVEVRKSAAEASAGSSL